IGGEGVLGAVGVGDDDPLARERVVHLHDALHQGFTTFPAFRHDVHTCTRFGLPLTSARTRCTFGFQRRFVRRCEWLRRMPKRGFLPHTSQTDAIVGNLSQRTGWTQKASSEADTIPAVGVLETLAPSDLRRVVSTYRHVLR